MQWYSKVMRKDYTVGLNVTATGVDDPDQLCAARSATIPAIVALRSIKLVDQQSMQSDPEKRKKLVWEIKRGWRRTAPGRSSSIPAVGPAASPM